MSYLGQKNKRKQQKWSVVSTIWAGFQSGQKGYSTAEVIGHGVRAERQTEKVRVRTARTEPTQSLLSTISSWDDHKKSRNTWQCVGVVKAASARFWFAWRIRLIPVMPRSWFEEWETSSDWQLLERAVGNMQQWNTEGSKLSWQDLIPMLCIDDRRNLFSFPWKNLLLWCLFGFCSSRLNILQLKVQSASL